jgi:hypothetical protein
MEAVMKMFAAGMAALIGAGALAACESSGGQYDGVSRFAGSATPFYGPGSPPREPPPEIPGVNDQAVALPEAAAAG